MDLVIDPVEEISLRARLVELSTSEDPEEDVLAEAANILRMLEPEGPWDSEEQVSLALSLAVNELGDVVIEDPSHT